MQNALETLTLLSLILVLLSFTSFYRLPHIFKMTSQIKTKTFIQSQQ